MTVRTSRGALGMIPVLLAGLTAGGCSLPVARAAPAAERLTPETFEAIRSRVLPTAEELAWQQVAWREGFFQGLLEAQAQDKPLFYWIYEGDPRGYT